jgi:hypothetical protein
MEITNCFNSPPIVKFFSDTNKMIIRDAGDAHKGWIVVQDTCKDNNDD